MLTVKPDFVTKNIMQNLKSKSSKQISNFINDHSVHEAVQNESITAHSVNICSIKCAYTSFEVACSEEYDWYIYYAMIHLDKNSD